MLIITGKNTRTAAIIAFDSWLSMPNQLLKIGAKAMIGTELAAIANGSSVSRTAANRAVTTPDQDARRSTRSGARRRSRRACTIAAAASVGQVGHARRSRWPPGWAG